MYGCIYSLALDGIGKMVTGRAARRYGQVQSAVVEGAIAMVIIKEFVVKGHVDPEWLKEKVEVK
jgi:hypothetical protein